MSRIIRPLHMNIWNILTIVALTAAVSCSAYCIAAEIQLRKLVKELRQLLKELDDPR